MNSLILSLLFCFSAVFPAASSSGSKGKAEESPFSVGQYDETKYVAVTHWTDGIEGVAYPFRIAMIMQLASGDNRELLQKFGIDLMNQWASKLQITWRWQGKDPAGEFLLLDPEIAGKLGQEQKSRLLCNKIAVLLGNKYYSDTGAFTESVWRASGAGQDGQDISLPNLDSLEVLYQGTPDAKLAYTLKFADAKDGDGSPVVSITMKKNNETVVELK